MRQALDRLTGEINVSALGVNIIKDPESIAEPDPVVAVAAPVVEEPMAEVAAEPVVEPVQAPESVAEEQPDPVIETAPVEAVETLIDQPADSGPREDTSGDTLIVA